MSWRIIDDDTKRVVESWESSKAAYRAMLILSAHAIKCGQKANYRVEPAAVIAYKLEELSLPDWALAILDPEKGPQ